VVFEHPFEVFLPSLFAPIVPGPEVVEHEVVNQRYLDGYDTGEKIEKPSGFGQKPEEEHVDHKTPGSYQTEFYEAPYFLLLSYRINSGVQDLFILLTYFPFFPSPLTGKAIDERKFIFFHNILST
jgi:hypothetical protein